MEKKINIIYFCTAEKGPSGGVKILYNHSKMINESSNSFKSQIIHIEKKKSSKWKNSINKILKKNDKNRYGWLPEEVQVKKLKTNWFDNKISIKKDFNFYNNTD